MRNNFRFYQVMGLTAVLLSGAAYAVDQSIIDEANKLDTPKIKHKPKPRPTPKHHHAKKVKPEAVPEVIEPIAPVQPITPEKQAFEPEMVAITGGCFQMGSPATEPAHQGDERQHQVCVDNFEIGKYEVTQAQWQAVMGNNPSNFKGNDLPVEEVSWNDVQTFIEKLNAKTGKSYRLPTEAQWEYAARAGTNTAYPWGDVASHDYANYGKDECCGGLVSGKDEWFNTSPVGKFPANAFGLHDMYGNVWEWTCSDYVSDYNGSEKSCSSNNDAKMPRVIRGGSWGNFPGRLRSAFRYFGTPAYRDNYLGFRLSRIRDAQLC